VVEPPPSTEPRPEIQIGGQAVIEGVVMRSPERWALAVRRPDGEVSVTINPAGTLAQRYPRWNKFPVRGIFAFVDSMVIGVKALTMSGEIYAAAAPAEPAAPPQTEAETSVPSTLRKEDQGEGEANAIAEKSEDRSGSEAGAEKTEKIPRYFIAFALLLGLGLFLGLFIVLPALVANSIGHRVESTIVYNLIEGGIRIAVFIGYIALMSLMPDIRRVFQYHGAEHKVVHVYEEGLPLTPQSAARFSTAHMRCGTAFIMIVLILSILVFSFLGRPAVPLRVLERLALIPFVAAISYEIIRFAGKHEDSTLMMILMSPGLLLQKLTTGQPDESQLEVAIRALEAAVDINVSSPLGGEG
jgi:uncharacterized protein YqhQ